MENDYPVYFIEDMLAVSGNGRWWVCNFQSFREPHFITPPEWTNDPQEAFHFSNKEDAEKTLSKCFDYPEGRFKVTEHLFFYPNPK